MTSLTIAANERSHQRCQQFPRLEFRTRRSSGSRSGRTRFRKPTRRSPRTPWKSTRPRSTRCFSRQASPRLSSSNRMFRSNQCQAPTRKSRYRSQRQSGRRTTCDDTSCRCLSPPRKCKQLKLLSKRLMITFQRESSQEGDHRQGDSSDERPTDVQEEGAEGTQRKATRGTKTGTPRECHGTVKPANDCSRQLHLDLCTLLLLLCKANKTR